MVNFASAAMHPHPQKSGPVHCGHMYEFKDTPRFFIH